MEVVKAAVEAVEAEKVAVGMVAAEMAAAAMVVEARVVEAAVEALRRNTNRNSHVGVSHERTVVDGWRDRRLSARQRK